MATKNIVPRGNGEGGLGTAAKGWGGAFLTSVAASSTSAGAKLQLISNDNAVLADTHQLGIIEFLGSEGGGTVSLGASIEAVADELFAANQNASALVFKTTSGTTVSEVLRLDKSKLATFAGGLDIAGAVDIAGDLTLSAGADGALNFSAASSIKILDNSATSLVIEEADTAYMTFVTTNSSEAIKFDKALDINAAVQLDSTLTVGVNDTGYDVKFFGATINEGVLYDTSEDELGLLLTTKLKFHDIGGGEEIFASADGHLEINAGTTLDITAPTVDFNAGALDMDLTDSSSITITSSEAAEDLTIEQIGANDSSIIIKAAGTGADAISIDASAGSVLLAPSLVDGQTLKLGKNGAVEAIFSPHGTAGSEKFSFVFEGSSVIDASTFKRKYGN